MLKCLLIKLYEYLDFLLNASEKKGGGRRGGIAKARTAEF